MGSRMKRLLLIGVVTAAAALAVAGVALAQTPTPTPKQAKANHLEFFLDRLAEKLGVERAELDEGLEAARDDTLDRAVQDGRLKQEQADKLKEREGLAPWEFHFRGFKPGQHPWLPRPKGLAPLANAAPMTDVIAEALGMTRQEMMSQIDSGKTLAEIAQGKEQAVKEAILKAEKEKLDQAVANERMSQEQADKAYDKLEKTDLLKMYDKSFRFKYHGNKSKEKPAPANKPSRGPAGRGFGTL